MLCKCRQIHFDSAWLCPPLCVLRSAQWNGHKPLTLSCSSQSSCTLLKHTFKNKTTLSKERWLNSNNFTWLSSDFSCAVFLQNIPGGWSCLWGFKRGTKTGHQCCVLQQRDNYGSEVEKDQKTQKVYNFPSQESPRVVSCSTNVDKMHDTRTETHRAPIDNLHSETQKT